MIQKSGFVKEGRYFLVQTLAKSSHSRVHLLTLLAWWKKKMRQRTSLAVLHRPVLHIYSFGSHGSRLVILESWLCKNIRPIPSMMSTACLPRSPNWSMMLARILIRSYLTTRIMIIRTDGDEDETWFGGLLDQQRSCQHPEQAAQAPPALHRSCLNVKYKDTWDGGWPWPPVGWTASCFCRNTSTVGSVSGGECLALAYQEFKR